MKYLKNGFILSILFCLWLTACGREAVLGTPAYGGTAESEAAMNDEISKDFAEAENIVSTDSSDRENTIPDNAIEMKDTTDMKINVQIGNSSFTATLEDNAAAREFAEMVREAPVSIDMSDYSGFEKVGALGRNLTTDNRQTTTHTGDIVLYNGNQIVMFYGSNSWSYTRIGKIDDLSGWKDALGNGSITAVFTLVQPCTNSGESNTP